MARAGRQRAVVFGVLVVLLGVVSFRIAKSKLPELTPAPESRLVGAFHVHTDSSHDSDLPIDTLAAAARSLALDFVVVTDHNAQLAAPLVRSDVLILSYAELSTRFGHLIGLGASDVLSPEARDSMDVHDAIRKLGGFPIVAHPSDRKRPWTGPMEHAAGLEIASFSAAARRYGGPLFLAYIPLVFAYRLNRELALAQIYDRDERALARWDDQADPGVVGMCGVDAHGRLTDLSLGLRAWLLVVEEDLPEGTGRAPALVQALAHGHFHCVAGLFGRDPEFSFGAYHEDNLVASPGGEVNADGVDELLAVGPTSTGEAATLVLLRNGAEVARAADTQLHYSSPRPGSYRVEVRLPVPTLLFGERAVPVIYSNRIRVRQRTGPTAASSPAPSGAAAPLPAANLVTAPTPEPPQLAPGDAGAANPPNGTPEPALISPPPAAPPPGDPTP